MMTPWITAITVTIPNAINVHKTAGLIPSSGAGAAGETVTWFETLKVNVEVGSSVATDGVTVMDGADYI
jgi:hypothetical protein